MGVVTGRQDRGCDPCCRALGSGASWLVIVATIPVADYDQQAAAVDGLLASLTSPSGSPIRARLPELDPGSAA